MNAHNNQIHCTHLRPYQYRDSRVNLGLNVVSSNNALDDLRRQQVANDAVSLSFGFLSRRERHDVEALSKLGYVRPTDYGSSGEHKLKNKPARESGVVRTRRRSSNERKGEPSYERCTCYKRSRRIAQGKK